MVFVDDVSLLACNARSCISAVLLVSWILPVLSTPSERQLSLSMVKLLMQWDIKAGREQDFSEFVVREFAPKLMQLGVQPNEVLYTMYGEGPQMLAIGLIESREKAGEILQSSGWKKLHGKLLTFVTNYRQKVVPDNGRDFQM
jgi:hypothetical protein